MKVSNKYKIYQIATSGLLLALSFVLGIISKFIPFFRMPSGGGISLAMIPLTFTGLILGPVYGLIAGLLYSIFNMLVDGAFSWGIPSLFLDYFLPYSSAAICGLFRSYFYKKKTWSIVVSLVSFVFIRFICHFLSGVLLFNPYFEETNKLFTLEAVSYSTIYNLGYLIPTLIVSLIVSLIISQPIFKLFNNSIFQVLGSKYFDKSENNLGREKLISYASILSLICLLFSYIFNIALKDIEVNLAFLSIISLSISTLLIVYIMILFNNENKEYSIKFLKENINISLYDIYFINVLSNTVLMSLSIVSICVNYS